MRLREKELKEIGYKPRRPRRSGIRLHRSVAKAINDHLRKDETKAHRQNDSDGGEAVGDCRAEELQGRMRAASKLYKPARHPEQVYARHHGNYGSEADGRERHVPTARDGSENQRDDETGDQRADGRAGAQHSKQPPPQSMGKHANRRRPGEHAQRRGKEDAEGGHSDARGDSIEPQRHGSAGQTYWQGNTQKREPEE